MTFTDANHNATNPNELQIALGFSGGGFRASAFNLGVLSYMDRLRIRDRSLLERVVTLSTVSGGTVTGARYAVGIKRNESFYEIYQSLHHFMRETDLVSLAIKRLTTDVGWDDGRIKSLINAFADVYDQYLFQGAKFGLLLTDDNPTHLRHLSFNATEFSNGLQFRFQWTNDTDNTEPNESLKPIVGNFNYRVPASAAKEIRMGDILAASSCFPGGFEPINFPTDFVQADSTELKALATQVDYPVGLMDGGIVDNQGIEPILLAEKRMQKNAEERSTVTSLVIVSDVASPFMDGYEETKEAPRSGVRALTPAVILILNTAIFLLSVAAVLFAVENDHPVLLIFCTMSATTSLIIYLLSSWLRKLPSHFQVPGSFTAPLGKLLKLKISVYETLIINRINSMLKLTNDVFLKHVRRLNYNNLYQDEQWLNRRMMNAIYELKPGNPRTMLKASKMKLPQALSPSAKIEAVALQASSMGTTLWFTKKEIQAGMLDAIIACGQFTFCWNLLEYISTIKNDRTNTTIAHADLIGLEQAVLDDWKLFVQDPFWLTQRFKPKP